MIVCECGLQFENGCDHASHRQRKAADGQDEGHHSVCSRCHGPLPLTPEGLLDTKAFRGLTLSVKGSPAPVLILCEPCRDWFIEIAAYTQHLRLL